MAATVAIGLAAAGAPAAHAAGFLGTAFLSGVTSCNFLAQSSAAVMLPDGTAVAAWVRRDDACVTTRVEVAVGAPQAPFGAPVVLSDPAIEASDVKLAVDESGTVIAVWAEGGVIRYSQRPPGGSFSAAQTIGAADLVGPSPDVAIKAGNVVVGWLAGGVPQLAIKAAGDAAFGPIAAFPTPTETAADVGVAINAAGAAVAVWQTNGPPLDTLHAAARAPGGVFTALAPVFTTAADADNLGKPEVAIDAAGRATLLWSYFDSASVLDIVKSADRGATGDFGPPQNLSDPGVDSGRNNSFDLAQQDDGTAIAMWWATTMQAAVRPAGGAFGSVIHDVSPPNFVITKPNVGFDPSGRAIAVWLSPGGATFQVEGAVLPKGAAAFGPVATTETVSAANGDGLDKATPIGIDNEGNAFTIWRRKSAVSPDPAILPQLQVHGAVFDTVAPVLGPLTVPATGTVGDPVKVSVAPTDRFSTVTTSWNFGDGATVTGSSVSHTYTKAGKYTVTATATDQGANAATGSDTIQISGGPGSGSSGTGGPTITGLRLSRKAFRAARSGAAVKPSAAATRFWTRVSYKVSSAATVRFSFERPRLGRRAGSTCAKPSRGNRGHKSCVRYIKVRGSFSRKRPRGGDRFTYTGRLSGHRLAVGRYRLVVTATAGGRRGRAAHASFRIKQ